MLEPNENLQLDGTAGSSHKGDALQYSCYTGKVVAFERSACEEQLAVLMTIFSGSVTTYLTCQT